MFAGPELLEGLVIAVSIIGLTKKVLLAVLAVLNGVLAILATLAVWKSYLVTGMKVFLTLVVVVPILGVVWYMIWGQRRVREAT
jgi:hypothetical protein